MDQQTGRTAALTIALSTAFLLTRQTLAADDAGKRCSPNGSACVYTSHGYATGAAGMCIGGACTFCGGNACGTACMGLRGQEQIACSRAVVRAQIAASEREQVAKNERAEATGLLERLVRETETDDCPPGVALGTNHCGQHWVQGLSDSDLSGAVALVQRQVDRVAAIFADLGLPVDQSNANQVAATAALVTKEKACRAAPQCMAERQAKALRDAMCADLAEIHNMQERIRIERANPGGVVDLQELHDDGEVIQRDQADLASKKADYMKLAHKSFTEAMCK